uniref:Uncharacterized protein n=1 Tax=Meloidogyne enterolobii TaxID=390850 RepID=A0A6V7W2D8_MELEN|nr:unnamed protein product [Meloidogyne enterolobii]
MREKYFLPLKPSRLLSIHLNTFIFFIYNCQNVYNKIDENLLLADSLSSPIQKVFKFIRQNEKLCGNIYINSTIWLPAYQNCQLKCRIDSEICQMSGPTVHIRRQRCYERILNFMTNFRKIIIFKFH